MRRGVKKKEQRSKTGHEDVKEQRRLTKKKNSNRHTETTTKMQVEKGKTQKHEGEGIYVFLSTRPSSSEQKSEQDKRMKRG